MAQKKKFYAVAVGRESGIFTSWPEAQGQVKGHPGAVFKGFVTREEANNWLKNPVYSSTKKKKTTKQSEKKMIVPDMPDPGQIVVYTDGSALGNPGPGGYGAVVLENGEQREFSAGYKHTTNNRMELMACIVALEQLGKGECPVSLYSDSQYVVNGIKKGWARSWQRKGWLKSDKTPPVNVDLWKRLLMLSQQRKVDFNWVRGHAGNVWNERCDELAVTAAKQGDLLPDFGYEAE